MSTLTHTHSDECIDFFFLIYSHCLWTSHLQMPGVYKTEFYNRAEHARASLYVFMQVCVEHRDNEEHCRGVELFIVLGGLLGAPPGVLLQDDELQDEPGRPPRPLHHHRVSAALQNVHPAFGQRLFDDHGSRDVHHLDTVAKRATSATGIQTAMAFLQYPEVYEWNAVITWSCLPHITCKGAVIRCKCSCKAYLDFSSTISINTV